TLTEDVRQVKLQMLKPLTHMDLGSLKMPLGTTRGTTNAVMFGVALGTLRDKDLELQRNVAPPAMAHHDMDAPPFWNVRRKKYIRPGGCVPRRTGPLRRLVMLPRNSGATLRGGEADYRDILAWFEPREPPPYPFAIDRTLASQGETAFNRECARCHGR